MLELEQALRDKSILVIDDMVEARATLKKMVNIFGAGHIDSAVNGDEAIHLLKRNNYDLVLSDYNLGKGKDGQQVLEEARFTGSLKASSLYVMVTGENTMDMVMGALEYEPDGYITKPYTIDLVRQRLVRILTIKNMLTDINAALDRKDNQGALKACNQALIKSPKLVLKILRIQGRIYVDEKQYEDALELYKKLLQKREVNWALLGKAVCLFHLKKYDAAEAVLLQALELFPLYVQCHDWLAKIHKLKGENTEAQQSLERAVDISPKAILRQQELGDIAIENKDFDVSSKAFKESIKLGRDSCYRSPDNYINYAKSLEVKIDDDGTKKTKDALKEAIKALAEVQDLYSDDLNQSASSQLMESSLYSKGGKKTEALKSLSAAQGTIKKIAQPKAELQLSLADTLVKNNKVEEALGIFSQMETDTSLDKETYQKLQDAKNGINGAIVDTYTTTLNDEAITLYEEGKVIEAMDIFNRATSFEDAGASVLLNAIQTMVAYMDNSEPNKEKINQCIALFKRIGDLPSNDDRYDRHQKLKKSIQDLQKSL